MVGKRPEKTYKAGKVQVNVWKNQGEKNGQTYESLSFQVSKNYKVGEDWKSTNNFTIQDLADLAILIREIQRDYRVKLFTNNESGEQSY